MNHILNVTGQTSPPHDEHPATTESTAFSVAVGLSHGSTNNNHQLNAKYHRFG
jgi:hypothetical protein